MDDGRFIMYRGENTHILALEMVEQRRRLAMKVWFGMSEEERLGTGCEKLINYEDQCSLLESKCVEELRFINNAPSGYFEDKRVAWSNWTDKWFRLVEDEMSEEEDEVEEPEESDFPPVDQYEYVCDGGCCNGCFLKECEECKVPKRWQSECHPYKLECPLLGGVKRRRFRRFVRRHGKRRVFRRNISNFPMKVFNKPSVRQRLRYITNAAMNDRPFTIISLLYFIVFGSGVTTAAYNMLDSVKLNCITIYGVPANDEFGPSMSEVSLQWINIGTGQISLTDRGTVSKPAKIVMPVPRRSLLDRFFNVTDSLLTTTCCLMTAPINAVVDFDISYTLLDGASVAVVLTSSPAAGVYRVNISGGQFIPDGAISPVTTTST